MLKYLLKYYMRIVNLIYLFLENILKFGLKYRSPSVAKPALEKFMLSLSKYAVFARTSARLSMKVEADEAKKCLSQTEL